MAVNTHIPASKIDILVMESPSRPEHEVTRREKELQQRIDMLEMQLRNMLRTALIALMENDGSNYPHLIIEYASIPRSATFFLSTCL